MGKKTTKFEKCDHVTWKVLGENRVILLDLNTGQYYSLNETATDIWNLIVSKKSVTDISNEIDNRYETDSDVLEDDVQKLIDGLLAKGLVSEMEDAVSDNTKKSPDTQNDLSSKPYIKPDIQEHAPIKQVTAGTYSIGTPGGHYWYPN